ncbi:MAG: GspE/PulE family protein [Candidatus Omnitrophota bacterium]|nr:GAF domain-containing protein [Candidatus Omnitrophota bacterium]MBU2528908.1 Flp pilus assembly complex ATPase component TadA [bacterium]MBU3929981.1 Flp pilus assembly complex ATPase component TadA [bacterium]MBU4122935.1 Flp pilus assembly complex ATPase component TadA [bacterium]
MAGIEDKLNRIIAPLLREIIFKKEISPEVLNTVLRITIEKIVNSLFAESITLYLVDKDKIKFSHVYFSPNLYKGNPALQKSYEAKRETLLKLTLPLNTGIVGKVISEGKSRVVEDVSKDADHAAGIDKDTGFQTRSMITSPLKADGKVIGAIQVLNKSIAPGYFSESDAYLLEEVAQYSAKIIQKAFNPAATMTPQELAYYIARLTKQQYIELGEDFTIANEILDETRITSDNLRKFRLIPIKLYPGRQLRVVCSNPLDYTGIENFEVITKCKVKETVVAAKSDIDYAIKNYLESIGEPASDEDEATAKMQADLEIKTSVSEDIDNENYESEESAPVIKLANQIIREAYNKKVSDIHIEAFEKYTMVRFRMDGVMKQVHKLPRSAHSAMLTRYKIMSSLDIAERRRPQDGRIKFKDFGKDNPDIELRVSIAPLVWGEKVCMRILDKTGTMLGLEAMGFSPKNMQFYRAAIAKPYGMILNVGPTGSGKTTTLYAAITEINKPDINIQTAEDPVEYMLEGINQMPVRKDIGVTFADALKCFLRQDPDVIMVGEIRDLETAEVAIEAALTGHLMLSTLHTNDASTTITRFFDMGVEPFLVSSSLIIVCAQRLVRRLCACKEEFKADADLAESLGIEPGTTLFRKAGCKKCDNTGYKGRIGVHEILMPDEEIRKLVIRKGVTPEEIQRAAIDNGTLVPMFQDGLQKCLSGVTSSEEVFRVLKKEQ